MKIAIVGTLALTLANSMAWAQNSIINSSTNQQVLEIGNANSGEVVIDNGAGQRVQVQGNDAVPVELDTQIKRIHPEEDGANNVSVESGNTGANTMSDGSVELETDDVDAKIDGDGSLGLSVGGINLQVK